MNICKDCKFFKRNKTSDFSFGECKSDKIRNNTASFNTDVLLYYPYHEDEAWCNVGETFGCIHFKRRKK